MDNLKPLAQITGELEKSVPAGKKLKKIEKSNAPTEVKDQMVKSDAIKAQLLLQKKINRIEDWYNEHYRERTSLNFTAGWLNDMGMKKAAGEKNKLERLDTTIRKKGLKDISAFMNYMEAEGQIVSLHKDTIKWYRGAQKVLSPVSYPEAKAAERKNNQKIDRLLKLQEQLKEQMF